MRSAVLVGGAVGDSIGAPFEIKKWNDPKLLTWDGSYQTSYFHKLEPGQFTDDTAFSMTLAESLLSTNKKYNPEVTAQKYLELSKSKYWRGAGKSTQQAIDSLDKGFKWYESGVMNAIGTGTAMRSAPLGVVFRNDINQIIRASKLDAMITHFGLEAEMGSLTIALAISFLLNKVGKDSLIEYLLPNLQDSKVKNNIQNIYSNNLISKTIKQREGYNSDLDKNGGDRIISQLILGNGFTVMECVARSLYCFIATRSFKEAIELAVRGGRETDTCASMVGQLCGAFYGLEGISQGYLNGLENANYLLELDYKLLNA